MNDFENMVVYNFGITEPKMTVYMSNLCYGRCVLGANLNRLLPLADQGIVIKKHTTRREVSVSLSDISVSSITRISLMLIFVV